MLDGLGLDQGSQAELLPRGNVANGLFNDVEVSTRAFSREDLSRVVRSSHFLPLSSSSGLEQVLGRNLRGAGTACGVGCALSDEPSAGVPFTALSMPLWAAEFSGTVGLDRRPAIIICEGLAYANPDMAKHQDQIAAARKWHQKVGQGLNDAGLAVEFIVDTEFTANADFRELRKELAGELRDETMTPTARYAFEQTARFVYLARTDNFIFKGGWAIGDMSFEAQHIRSAARTGNGGICERAFDVEAGRYAPREFGSYYGAPPLTSQGPVCPYTVGSEGAGSRLLLIRDAADVRAIEAHLQAMLETSSRDKRKLDNKLDNYKRVYDLCELAWKHIPKLQSPSPLTQMEFARSSEQVSQIKENPAHRNARIELYRAQLPHMATTVCELIELTGI